MFRYQNENAKNMFVLHGAIKLNHLICYQVSLLRKPPHPQSSLLHIITAEQDEKYHASMSES